MNDVLSFLRRAGVFFLATEDGNQPRVRPFGIAEIYDNRLYVLTGKKKKVSKQIKENPNVEVCASVGEVWIRITGKLISDDSVAAKKYILDKNPHLRSMYDENDDNTEVLYFEDAVAVISSFVEEDKIIKL